MLFKDNQISVEIIKDSYNPEFSSRITTMILEYPRIVHSELMTHRCLVGGTKLVFDLPSGQAGSKFRKHEMTIEDFYDKWNFGGKERKPSRAIAWDFSAVSPDNVYTAKDLATIVGMSSASNIRQACREGNVVVQNPNKNKYEDYLILGSDFINYKSSPNSYRQNIRKRLDAMNIRMLDTETGEVKHTNITDIWFVGEKETYTLVAGKYSITGTYDHSVLTDSGWKNLSEITSEDSVVIVSNKQKFTKDQKAMKYIDGKWRSSWQKKMLNKLDADQHGICSCCGKQDKLEIHHIKPVYSNPELTFDELNIIAICKSCHKTAHEKQGWQEGNPLSASYVKVASVVKTGKVEKVYDLSVSDENHNFVANGIVVHNCFSRNSSSSRAIPVEKVIEQVRNNPAMPVRFGKNKAGMQDDGEFYPELGKKIWLDAVDAAVCNARTFLDCGFHKQVANRILEPYQFIRVCLTSTNWNNWFNLRNHPDADPTIHALAETMEKAMDESIPKHLVPDHWHIPFVNEETSSFRQQFFDENGNEITLKEALMISASCAAQTSYRKLDFSIEKAKNIYNKLIISKPCHASPVEHCARAIPKFMNPMDYFNLNGVTHIDRNGIPWSGNFHGYIQYRQLIENNAEYY